MVFPKMSFQNHFIPDIDLPFLCNIAKWQTSVSSSINLSRKHFSDNLCRINYRPTGHQSSWLRLVCFYYCFKPLLSHCKIPLNGNQCLGIPQNIKYIPLETSWKDLHAASYINYTHITVMQTLFPKRIKFESHSRIMYWVVRKSCRCFLQKSHF